MHLVQILLPLNDNAGQRFSQETFASVREELIDRYHGLTAYTRSPAKGLWKPNENEPPADDEIVIYEVMDAALDAEWWREFRGKLEVLFRQDSIIIRASEIVTL